MQTNQINYVQYAQIFKQLVKSNSVNILRTKVGLTGGTLNSINKIHNNNLLVGQQQYWTVWKSNGWPWKGPFSYLQPWQSGCLQNWHPGLLLIVSASHRNDEVGNVRCKSAAKTGTWDANVARYSMIFNCSRVELRHDTAKLSFLKLCGTPTQLRQYLTVKLLFPMLCGTPTQHQWYSFFDFFFFFSFCWTNRAHCANNDWLN